MFPKFHMENAYNLCINGKAILNYIGFIRIGLSDLGDRKFPGEGDAFFSQDMKLSNTHPL